MAIQYSRTEDLQACFDIRRQVFIVEQNVPENLEIDGLDTECTHYLASNDDGKAIGTCRVRFTEECAKIERVAVLENMRGFGIGKGIMAYVIDDIAACKTMADKNIRHIKLGAQIHAKDFYHNLGFTETGNPYMDAGIEHIDMVLKV